MVQFVLLLVLMQYSALHEHKTSGYTYAECLSMAQEVQKQQMDEWQVPEEVKGEKPTLKFYRIRMDSALGDWHLYNKEDENFLRETAKRIKNGQYRNTKIEWTLVEGRLPL